MTQMIWIIIAATALLLAGTTVALAGRSGRRQLAGRIAEVQPTLAVTREASTGQRTARLPRFVLIDQLFGLDRDRASDTMIPILRCAVMGALGGIAVYAVAHLLLGIDQAYAIAAAAAAGVYYARLAVAKKRGKVEDKMEDELSQALGVIIRCVRVGLPVLEGMRAAGNELPAPTGPEFRRCVDQIALGENFDTALQHMAARCTLSGYRFLAVTISLQRQTGGNLSETLDNLAETLRKRKALRLKVQALISEPMATVAVLSVLPFVVGAILMAVRPDYVMTLFTTDTGRLILGIAIVIQSVGLLVIRTLIKQTLA